MNEQITTPATEVSFKDFLFKNKRNRTILILAGMAIVVQFAIFKYLYPFASYIHGDSFSYINAAEGNLSINTYLIGYSKFLRLFSVISNSDFLLTSFQYLFIHGSVLFLLFTIFYFYSPKNLVRCILLCFMVFNPLFLHLGNLISSDGFFLGLSMIWFTLLLWIINKPSKNVLIWHAIVLFLAFTVRYNAMIYPIISATAFWLSKLSIKQKLVSLFASVSLCVLFMIFTSFQYKKLTGYWQYSPFSGWQLANNAMYAYRYVDINERKSVPNKFLILDNMIRAFYDSTKDTKKYPSESMMASTFYMWSPGMPLYKYKDLLFKKDSQSNDLKKWASMGPFYKKYGLYIIKKYPWHFVQYFIWPNANKYYAPPVEFLESYNGGRDRVTTTTKKWFNYKNTKVNTRMKNNKVWILDFYPILSGIINLVIICSLSCYLLLKGWKNYIFFNRMVLLGCIFWLLNAGFTISASSAALRFQSFPILLTTTLALMMIDWMINLMSSIRRERTNILTSSESLLPSEIIA
jgi:hypothetical protein